MLLFIVVFSSYVKSETALFVVFTAIQARLWNIYPPSADFRLDWEIGNWDRIKLYKTMAVYRANFFALRDGWGGRVDRIIIL